MSDYCFEDGDMIVGELERENRQLKQRLAASESARERAEKWAWLWKRCARSFYRAWKAVCNEPTQAEWDALVNMHCHDAERADRAEAQLAEAERERDELARSVVDIDTDMLVQVLEQWETLRNRQLANEHKGNSLFKNGPQIFTAPRVDCNEIIKHSKINKAIEKARRIAERGSE